MKRFATVGNTVMGKKTMKKNCRTVVLAALITVLAFSGAASAHIFVLKPEVMEAGKGAAVSFTAGLAEPLIVLDMSRPMLESMGFTVGMEASVKYKNGVETDIPLDSFKPAYLKNPSLSAPVSADAEISQLQLTEEGTAVLHGSFSMERDGKKTLCFAKTFVNLTNDGMSTEIFAGADEPVAEILFTENVKAVKSGDTLKVRVLLKGKPLADADISATFDGAPAKKTDSPENEYLTVKTNAAGEASFAVDKAGLWISSIEYQNPEDGIRYRSSLLFQVQ